MSSLLSLEIWEEVVLPWRRLYLETSQWTDSCQAMRDSNSKEFLGIVLLLGQRMCVDKKLEHQFRFE